MARIWKTQGSSGILGSTIGISWFVGTRGALRDIELMMERLKSWLKERFSANDVSPQKELGKTGSFGPAASKSPKKVPRPSPEYVEVDSSLHSKVENQGPGKNVLIQNPYIREETGTHETLKILDDSIVDTGEETGIDPYNTGGFDRSKKWDQRFRK